MGRVDNFKIFEERVFSSIDLNQTLHYIGHTKGNKLAGLLIDLMQHSTYTPDVDFLDIGKELNEITFIARNRVDYKDANLAVGIYDSEKRQSIRLGRIVRKLLSSLSNKDFSYNGAYYIATYNIGHETKTDILFPQSRAEYDKYNEIIKSINKLNSWSRSIPNNVKTKCIVMGKGEVGYIPSGYISGSTGDGGHLENDNLKEFNINQELDFSNIDTKSQYSSGPYTQICRHFNIPFYGFRLLNPIMDEVNEDTIESFITMSGEIKVDVDVNFSDSDIEQFVNEFVAARKMYDFDKSGLEFKLVKGEDIRKYYLYTNYFGYDKDNKTPFIKGTLWNSCMRHTQCQDYLDIYCKNSAVSLLILVTPEDKIVGRALIWKLNEKNDNNIYMDREYTIYDADVKLFNNYAIKEGWIYEDYDGYMLNGTEYPKDLYVSLEKMYFDEYPYMDTLKYLGNKTLTSSSHSRHEFELNDTEGHWEGYDEGDDDY